MIKEIKEARDPMIVLSRISNGLQFLGDFVRKIEKDVGSGLTRSTDSIDIRDMKRTLERASDDLEELRKAINVLVTAGRSEGKEFKENERNRGPEIRPCDWCNKVRECYLYDFIGEKEDKYSEWLCRKCAQEAYKKNVIQD